MFSKKSQINESYRDKRHTFKIRMFSLCAVSVAGLALLAVEARATCPCDFAASVKARTLKGSTMGCGFIDNLVTHAIIFSAVNVKKGGTGKRWDYDVAEPAPGSPLGGNPACRIQVTRIGKNGNKTISSQTIDITPAEADACAADLSAFAFGQLTQKGADSPQAPCEDNDGNGVIDSWEFF